jgi:hypothetical protein
MTVLIDLTIQNLLERKYKIENCKSWFSKFYWFKTSEMQKIDKELQQIFTSHFTKVLLPEKKYRDFTFDDIFETYLEYYIFDDSYISLGKYINTYSHMEMMGITDPVQVHILNAIFLKDSTGSNIYTHNDTIISRPIYVKTIHTNSVKAFS